MYSRLKMKAREIAYREIRYEMSTIDTSSVTIDIPTVYRNTLKEVEIYAIEQVHKNKDINTNDILAIVNKHFTMEITKNTKKDEMMNNKYTELVKYLEDIIDDYDMVYLGVTSENQTTFELSVEHLIMQDYVEKVFVSVYKGDDFYTVKLHGHKLWIPVRKKHLLMFLTQELGMN